MSMFSAGDAYERFMGRWSRRLAPLFVEFAGIRDGDSVLDVGAGTGALTAAIAAAAPSSRVLGVEPSEPFVSLARARHGSDLITFEPGDVQRLRFENASFDQTLSLLMLNFVPRPGSAVSELLRVTRRGGTVAACVWDYAAGMEMLRVFWDEAIALNPDMDLQDERHMRFSRDGELGALWRNHGMHDVSNESLSVETRFSSFDDYWLPFLDGQGPAGAFVVALPADRREQLRLQLRRRLLGGGPDRPIVLHARAWAVRGVVS